VCRGGGSKRERNYCKDANAFGTSRRKKPSESPRCAEILRKTQKGEVKWRHKRQKPVKHDLVRHRGGLVGGGHRGGRRRSQKLLLVSVAKAKYQKAKQGLGARHPGILIERRKR